MAQQLKHDLATAGLLEASDAQPYFGDVNVAAKILDTSPSYLNKIRMTGGGPPYVKFNAKVKYVLPRLLPWAMTHLRGSTSDPGHIDAMSGERQRRHRRNSV
jgi:hypothetical protein